MIRWGGGGWRRRKVTNSSLLVFNIFDLTKAHFSWRVEKRKEQERRDRRKELRRAIKKMNRVINQDGWATFISLFLPLQWKPQWICPHLVSFQPLHSLSLSYYNTFSLNRWNYTSTRFFIKLTGTSGFGSCLCSFHFLCLFLTFLLCTSGLQLMLIF